MRFKTSGEVTPATFKQIGKYLVPQKNRRTFLLLSVICFALLILGIVLRNISMIIIFIAGCGLFIADYFISISKRQKSLVSSMQQNIKKSSEKFENGFNDEGMIIHSLDSHSIQTYKYSDISSIIEIDSLFVIMDLAFRPAVVFKNNLSEEDKKNFIKYIKSKCPTADIILK